MNLNVLHRRLMRALAGRGLPRDLIDIHAASQSCSISELESLGRRHACNEEFSLSELRHALMALNGTTTKRLFEYSLSVEQITDLRRWAQAWADDILRRINAETYEDDDGELL